MEETNSLGDLSMGSSLAPEPSPEPAPNDVESTYGGKIPIARPPLSGSGPMVDLKLPDSSAPNVADLEPVSPAVPNVADLGPAGNAIAEEASKKIALAREDLIKNPPSNEEQTIAQVLKSFNDLEIVAQQGKS